MKRLSVVITATVLPITLLAASTEPQNLAFVKKQLQQYHDSGQYEKAIETQATQAQQYLAKRISQNNQLKDKKQLAIVLDIDETSLSNYPGMVKMSFGGTMQAIDAQEAQANDPAIKPVLNLYKFAKANAVKVFFLTGRNERFRKPTQLNLEKAGYHNWDHLYLKPNGKHFAQTRNYKAPVRCALEKKGYDIVLTVGDQYSDLQGGCAEKGVKLPNPFYYIA